MRLLLAGIDVGGYRAFLEELASNLGVRDAVHFLGFVDPRQVFWASDVDILPSSKESFGPVVVEGMF